MPVDENENTHELVEIAFKCGGSVRLKNSLLNAQNEGLLEGITASGIIQSDPGMNRRLQLLRNFGIKTLAELVSIIGQSTFVPNISATSSNSDLTKAREHSCTYQLELQEPRIEVATDALKLLDRKSRQVLEMRLGIGSGKSHTLAEIAYSMNVSRERIRQIEFKAVQSLTQTFTKTFCALENNFRQEELAKSATHGTLRVQDIDNLLMRLPEDARIVVRVLYKNVRAWLSATCHQVEQGWVLERDMSIAFSDAKHWYEHQLKALSLPCPLSYILKEGGASANVLKSVITLSSITKLEDGYILPRGSTRRARRAARVHRLLWTQRAAKPMSASNIREAYLDAYFDDQCTVRDLLVILLENNHLFLNLYELGWVALGRRPDQSDEEDLAQVRDREQDSGIHFEELQEGATLRAILAKILIENGPQSFNDLRRLFSSKVGNRFSKASVGPILISTDEFARVGPGIYAHKSQLEIDHFLKDCAERLLTNKNQCEIFCRAVWAGEEESLYPLWFASMQPRWAEWCYETKQVELLSSLLSICDITSWPVKTGDKLRWQRIKENYNTYLLEEPPPDLDERIPSYREFLAGAALAINQGKVSWISINRASGYRIEDRHSASLLSLLISIGIIHPSNHWQQQHRTAENAEQIVLPLLDSLRSQQQTKWPKSVLRAIRSGYENIYELGWTEIDSTLRLLDALSQMAIGDELGQSDLPLEVDSSEKLRKQLSDDLLFANMRRRLAETTEQF
jgi:hypothetical protein